MIPYFDLKCAGAVENLEGVLVNVTQSVRGNEVHKLLIQTLPKVFGPWFFPLRTSTLGGRRGKKTNSRSV